MYHNHDCIDIIILSAFTTWNVTNHLKATMDFWYKGKIPFYLQYGQ